MTSLEMERMIACCAYTGHVKMQWEHLEFAGLYGADSERIRLHDEMCVSFGVPREKTLQLTGSLEKINFDGRILYDNLLELLDKLEENNKK